MTWSQFSRWTHGLALLGLLGWLGLGISAGVAQPLLVRGPYLQNGGLTNITIRWRTSLPASTLVRYGTNQLELARSHFQPEPVTDHLAVLSDLSPGTRYYYAVGHQGDILASGPDYYFRTAPATNEAIRIWSIGDAGTVSVGNLGALEVRDAYKNYAGTEPTDVWLMLGDNAYFQGTDAQYQIAVFDAYPSLLRQTVAWSTVGNHEIMSRDTEGHFPYLDIFSPPQNGEAGGVPSGTSLYYSFDYANAHFVCLDSEINRGTNETMVAWLQEDLAATTKDWVIAFWHTPPYTKGSHDSDNVFDSSGGLFIMRTNILPILESHGVDLVLCGHSHNYERSFLLNGHYGTSDELDPSMILDDGSGRMEGSGAYIKPLRRTAEAGTVYIVNGSSGWTRGSPERLHPAMFTQVVEIGSVVIDIKGGRLDARFLRETGAIDDSFTILKNNDEVPFRIQFFQRSTDSKDVLAWRSEPGTEYQVETTAKLNEPIWMKVSGSVIATSFTTYFTNDLTTLLPGGYYRVRRVLSD